MYIGYSMMMERYPYPEGIDNTNSPHPSSTYWAMPNSLVGNPLEVKSFGL